MKAVLALGLQLCLVNVIFASTFVGPRGPRPIENRDRYRSKQCLEKEWPICSDDDWGPKCPSGCRLQGLMNAENQKNADRIKDIRQMLELYSTSFGKTRISVNEAVNKIRQTLNGLGGYGNTYNQLVEHLNNRLTILQNRVNDQIAELNQIKSMLIAQFNEVTKLEVDIDMKIRACKGSCKQAFTYNINREQNAQIEKNFRSVTYTSLERIQYGRTTRIFKMKPIKETVKDTRYKSVSLAEPFDNTQKQYPEFWKEIAAHKYILESSTADASVSPISSVVSDRKGAILTQSSDRKYAGQAGTKTSETVTHFYGMEQPRYNFTKDIGHGSFFETFSNRSEMTISHPHYPDDVLKGLGIKSSMTKSSVTTLTRTSELRHTKTGGTKSNILQTIHGFGIVDNSEASGRGFLTGEEEFDLTSRLISSLTQKDGDSSSHRTFETDQFMGGFPKGFKSSSGANPARLSDDETGESDPSAYLLHRKK